MGNYIIQLRRDNSQNWNSVDPVLYEGELGYETDTGKAKMGDGIRKWSNLSYWPKPGLELLGPSGSIGASGEVFNIMGLTGDAVNVQLDPIENIPLYEINVISRTYCIRFDYGNSDSLVSKEVQGGPRWKNTNVTVNINTNPRSTATIKFGEEDYPPKNIYAYFYNAIEDKYKLSTFGLGSYNYIKTSSLNSNISGNKATNDLFGNFKEHWIEIDMTISGYGGQSTDGIRSHAYLIFDF